MNAAVILLVSIAILACGYVFYGGWLAKKWGIDPKKKTPAFEHEDGMDYVPAKAPVLMGHHFSSIAGAGPINGPIQAAIFGWVPVLLWILIGGIFMGGVHDFGALFASIRNDGKSIGEVIADTMGEKTKKIFLAFGYLTLLLVVAAFGSIVASTFGVTNMAGAPVTEAAYEANTSTAMISLLFILLAIVFGLLVYRAHMPIGIASVIGVVGIIVITALGLNFHPIALSYKTWMIVLGAYIAIASVTPVWILLQPRDYLSSFLLYFMIAVSVIGILGCALTGNASIEMPAFLGSFTAPASNGLFATGTMFPALFVTIACGAISGFHSLVSSGTTSKQISSEKDARPVAYGSMLIECVVAVISLCAVGFCWNKIQDAAASEGGLAGAGLAAPTAVFATGVSQMIGTFAGGTDGQVARVMYNMLVLAVSVFCLTSLDTATRLARYMFQEFWLAKGEQPADAKGVKKVLANPYFATVLTVVLGIALGLTGYTKIWPLFGAANQLLAAVGLIAVCAWLKSIGRNNKMFYIPMAFMLIVAISSLIQTIIAKCKVIADPAGADKGWMAAQGGIAVLLVLLAVTIFIDAAATIFKADKKKDSAEAK